MAHFPNLVPPNPSGKCWMNREGIELLDRWNIFFLNVCSLWLWKLACALLKISNGKAKTSRISGTYSFVVVIWPHPLTWLDHTHTINQLRFYLFMDLCNFLSIFVPNIIKFHKLCRCANSTTVTGPQYTNGSARKKKHTNDELNLTRTEKNSTTFFFQSLQTDFIKFSFARFEYFYFFRFTKKKRCPRGTFATTSLLEKTFRILTIKNIKQDFILSIFQLCSFFVLRRFFFAFCVNVKWKKIPCNWSFVYNGTNQLSIILLLVQVKFSDV